MTIVSGRALPEPLSLPPAMPRRYLALWLPFLSTDRARGQRRPDARPDDAPFALVEKEHGALRIAAADAPAMRQGVRVGAPLAEMRALCPALITAPADREADAAVLRACAFACEMFTPMVALRGGDGLVLDITGCAHLFGGEADLLQAARLRIRRLGLLSCAAIAGTPDSAWAFARYRRGTIASPGEEEALARALPIAALDQDNSIAVALARAGFRTLEDLATRPTQVLTARFGEALVSALRRILGQEDLRISPLRPLPLISAECQFPEPIALMESLMAALERLAGDVSASLETRREGGRAFEASVFRADGHVRRIRVETADPTRDVAVLMRLFRLRFDVLADPLDPGFGFDALRLAVIRSEPLAQKQQVLAGGDRQEVAEAEALADLASRLIARFGRENVQRFIGRDTHDPARAGDTTPFLSPASHTPFPEPEPGHPPERPLTLFAHPQLVEVMAEVPDAPPLRFRWRRVLHEVTRAEGPERIAPEWWREAVPAPATRDYYRIEDAEGHRFWLFREGLYEDTNARPRWFLHGIFA